MHWQTRHLAQWPNARLLVHFGLIEEKKVGRCVGIKERNWLVCLKCQGRFLVSVRPWVFGCVDLCSFGRVGGLVGIGKEREHAS